MHQKWSCVVSVAACLLSGATDVAATAGMRCGQRLVSKGDTLYAVRAVCGEPDAADRRVVTRSARRRVRGPCFKGEDGKLRCERSEEIFVDVVMTLEDPLRVLVSGCLAGWGCGVDGGDYSFGARFRELLALPTFRALPFCPEAHALGIPCTMPDIHGGDGFDVIAGGAKVLDEHGCDLTAKMVEGAQAMLAFAQQARAELAILTDMSAACGSQVISDGCRLVEDRRWQKGVGVATPGSSSRGPSACLSNTSGCWLTGTANAARSDSHSAARRA